MANKLYNDVSVQDIADAIREKNGLSTTYTISQMGNAIRAIPTGSAINNQNKTVTPTESQQSVTPDSGYTGLGTVTVEAIESTYVGSSIPRRTSEDLIFNNGSVYAQLGYYPGEAYYVVPSSTLPATTASSATSGYTSKATISRSTSDQYININPGYINDGSYYKISAVANGSATTPATTITVNPTISISNAGLITADVSGSKSITPAVSAGYVSSGTSGTVSVSGTKTQQLTTKSATTITPTESEQLAVDTNVYTLGQVKVGAISSTYVGSDITQRDSDDLTSLGATVSVPAGYYASDASKSISSGSATNSGTASASSATITTGTNTITLSKAVSITPTVSAGYISSGTAGNVTVSLTGSATVDPTPTASGKTVTIPAGYYTESTTKDVSTGSATGPSSLSGSSASISTGTNTITLTKTGVSTTPTITAGYVSSATASTATVSLTASATINPTPTASGKTVTVPAGYYTQSTTTDVSMGSATAPASISGSSSTISTGTNTLTLTKTVSVTPNVTTAGYISAGTAGNSSVSLTANVTVDPTPTASGATVTIPQGYYTEQITKSVSSGSATGPTSLSGSSATVTTGTNTITLTKTGVSTTPTVSAGYVSSATSSTATVALTASVPTKASATITPGTTNQTIASGTYLTGTQTITGDTNLVGSNIISGKSIFGVSGTVVINKYYTGSSAPSSSLGSNGDIYLQN